VGAKRGKQDARRPEGRQRLALIVFGALFVLLFLGFAVAQGIGGPSVPSDAVAVVEDVPDDLGTVSDEEFERAFEQQAAQENLKKVPEPGDDKYEEVREAALSEVLNAIWLKGQAEELEVTVTDKQIETELEKIKKESFPTDAAYKKFLQESKFTQAEVDDRVELQLLSTQVQEKVSAESPQPTSIQVEDYYEQEKETRFTTKETRDIRLVINEDKSKVVAAKKELEKDNSPATWKKVAAKYSIDPTSKSKGGLQEGLSEETLPSQLKKAIFESATGELIGPLKFQSNYLELEVAKLNPAKTESLQEARNEITSTLVQEQQQEYFGEFVSGYQSKWQQRTTCAEEFVALDDAAELCANAESSGHPSNAPPACYEADPKTPANECPAPVTPIQPALPGTVTPLKPKGEPFVQRPRPAPAAATDGAAAPEGVTGEEGAPAPEGAPEPEGSAPPEGAPAPEGSAPPAGAGAGE
jgi:foldase protein PrsA